MANGHGASASEVISFGTKMNIDTSTAVFWYTKPSSPQQTPWFKAPFN
jgi:hypothetical protein